MTKVHHFSITMLFTLKGEINRYFSLRLEPLNWKLKHRRYSIYDHVDYMTHRCSLGPIKFSTGRNMP